jgi:hypothetical protein
VCTCPRLRSHHPSSRCFCPTVRSRASAGACGGSAVAAAGGCGAGAFRSRGWWTSRRRRVRDPNARTCPLFPRLYHPGGLGLRWGRGCRVLSRAAPRTWVVWLGDTCFLLEEAGTPNFPRCGGRFLLRTPLWSRCAASERGTLRRVAPGEGWEGSQVLSAPPPGRLDTLLACMCAPCSPCSPRSASHCVCARVCA